MESGGGVECGGETRKNWKNHGTIGNGTEAADRQVRLHLPAGVGRILEDVMTLFMSALADGVTGRIASCSEKGSC